MAADTIPPHASLLDTAKNQTAMAIWLFFVAALVFAMVIVGGATRLTDSGLSITEWKPLLGAIPPLTDADWAIAFEKYKKIPEYTQINEGMSLAEFKYIFWWEWAHRFLGRFIGLAFAIGLVWFWLSGRIVPGYKARLIGLFLLGGLQGFVGWYMVKSGLVDRVDVSQYRLAMHLSLAFLIFSGLIWVGLDLLHGGAEIRVAKMSDVSRGLVVSAALLVALIFVQVALGAFVAGTKAGLTYNTWPLMDGRFVPDGLGQLTPWYLNVFENITAIQFNHRMAAYLVLAVAAGHVAWVCFAQPGRGVMVSAWVVLVGVLAQALVGIATLLMAEGSIPIGLGLAHQGGGAVVMGLATWHLHRLWQLR
ncbi:MAG: COX15/CtaA family protein [Hyphomicrobiaceae bacterium]